MRWCIDDHSVCCFFWFGCWPPDSAQPLAHQIKQKEKKGNNLTARPHTHAPGNFCRDRCVYPNGPASHLRLARMRPDGSGVVVFRRRSPPPFFPQVLLWFSLFLSIMTMMMMIHTHKREKWRVIKENFLRKWPWERKGGEGEGTRERKGGDGGGGCPGLQFKDISHTCTHMRKASLPTPPPSSQIVYYKNWWWCGPSMLWERERECNAVERERKREWLEGGCISRHLDSSKIIPFVALSFSGARSLHSSLVSPSLHPFYHQRSKKPTKREKNETFFGRGREQRKEDESGREGMMRRILQNDENDDLGSWLLTHMPEGFGGRRWWWWWWWARGWQGDETEDGWVRDGMSVQQKRKKETEQRWWWKGEVRQSEKNHKNVMIRNLKAHTRTHIPLPSSQSSRRKEGKMKEGRIFPFNMAHHHFIKQKFAPLPSLPFLLPFFW